MKLSELFRFILLMLSLNICISCRQSEITGILSDVESYIMDRPDSALAVIESIDESSLGNRRNRAHHALLHAMALDKNYVDVSDDSLAQTAVKYFRKKGSPKYYIRSLYYLGLSYYYAKEYDKAIIEFTRAESLAKKCDSLYLGFVKVAMSDIYSINYNSVEEQRCLEEALNVYTSINAEYYVAVAKMRLARAYINNEYYDRAKCLLDSLTHSDKIPYNIRRHAIRDLAYLYSVQEKPNPVLSSDLYNELLENGGETVMTLRNYWTWAYALCLSGETAESEDMVNELEKIDTSGTAAYWQYRISKNLGNNEKALHFLETHLKKDNEQITDILKQSFSCAQRDYYESQTLISEYKLYKRNMIIYIVSLFSVLVLFVFGVLAVSLINKQKEEKAKYLQYAEEISRQLKEYEMCDGTSLKKKYISLYKEKYTTLGELFEQYVQSSGRVDAERMIYKKVTSLIEELRAEMNNSDEFEAMLDKDMYGVMTNLRKELPKLKEKYYRLFIYIAVGFDPTVISHFMDCTINIVYIMKSRLKGKIVKLNTLHKEQFLEIINS